MTKSRRYIRLALQSSVMLTTFAIMAAGAWRLHKSRSVQLFGEMITSVATADSVVALTFDDGPSDPYTSIVLDILRDRRVPATFFVTGSAVERHGELARRMVAEGHELGNHSYSHERMVLRSPSSIRHEVESTDSLLRAAGAAGAIHFRPPYGKRLVGLPWYLSRTKRLTVLWTLEPDSWFTSAADMTRHVLDNVKPGSIVLLHVEMPSRMEQRTALPEIIDGLRGQGYNLVTVSQLLRSALDRPNSR